jgi:hypothetical protein
VETKVAVLDSFHFVLTALFDDLAAYPQGPRLAEATECIFDIIFALLEVPPSSTASDIPRNTVRRPNLARGLPTTLPFITNPLHRSPTRSGKGRKIRFIREHPPILRLGRRQPQQSRRPQDPSPIQPGIDNLGKRNTRSHSEQVQTTAPQSQLDLKGKRKAKNSRFRPRSRYQGNASARLPP